jgi:hypothetical protein
MEFSLAFFAYICLAAGGLLLMFHWFFFDKKPGEATPPGDGGGATLDIEGIFARFKASDLSLADSAEVSSFPDSSGNGFDLAPFGTAPTFTESNAEFNGKSTVTFGASNGLQRSTADVGPLDHFTVIAIAKVTSEGYLFTQATNAIHMFSGDAVPPLRCYRNNWIDGGVGASASWAQTGAPALIVGSYGGQSVLRVDGSVVGSSSGTGTPLSYTGVVSVFSDSAGNNAVTGELAELIILDREASADDLTAIAAYAAAEYGI